MLNDAEYNSRIEKVAELILKDRVSHDEQDKEKLKKYQDFAKKQFNLENELALQLVNESFLYLKLKGSDSIDPLQHGDQFGAGFS
jgi:hypothetical protein